MRLFRCLQLTCALMLAAAGAACDEKLSELAGPTPNLTPTFASIQKEIFNTQDASGRLSCIQCHTNQGRTPAGGLLLTDGNAYGALVGRPSPARAGEIFVIPGDPERSYLVRKLEGAADITGARMPRSNGPFLTPGQMLVIRRWIQEGAANN
jgi:hypothetical protein